MLRPELAPPQLESDYVEYLSQLAARIFSYLFLRLDAQLLIDHFCGLTGYSPTLLVSAAQLHVTNPRQFVEQLLVPNPGQIADLTDPELCELIRRIIEREGEPYELRFWEEIVRVNIPGQAYNRLYNSIYWPHRPMTPEEMLIDALRQPLPGI
jgi:hypothetical protein